MISFILAAALASQADAAASAPATPASAAAPSRPACPARAASLPPRPTAKHRRVPVEGACDDTTTLSPSPK